MRALSRTKVWRAEGRGKEGSTLICRWRGPLLILHLSRDSSDGFFSNVYMKVPARHLSSVPLSQRDPSIPFSEQVDRISRPTENLERAKPTVEMCLRGARVRGRIWTLRIVKLLLL